MTLADLMRQHRLTETRTEGYTPDGRCRGCGARPAHHTATRLGAYCLACCHWITKETT